MKWYEEEEKKELEEQEKKNINQKGDLRLQLYQAAGYERYTAFPI